MANIFFCGSIKALNCFEGLIKGSLKLCEFQLQLFSRRAFLFNSFDEFLEIHCSCLQVHRCEIAGHSFEIVYQAVDLIEIFGIKCLMDFICCRVVVSIKI